MQFQFGAGRFFGIPLYDALGNAITNPTPVQIGVIQDLSLSFSADVKTLHGAGQFALAAARGMCECSGSVTFAQLSGRALNSLYFGTGTTAGTMQHLHNDVAGQAIPSTPFQITITPAGSGTFVEDLGVLNASGVPMTRVASAPSTGQYSVSGAVYTFAAADTGLTVYLSYRYSTSTAGAQNIALTNVDMGNLPTFKGLIQTQYQGKKAVVLLEQVASSTLQLLSTTLDDFSKQSIDFTAFSNAAGTSLGNIWIQEQ